MGAENAIRWDSNQTAEPPLDPRRFNELEGSKTQRLVCCTTQKSDANDPEVT